MNGGFDQRRSPTDTGIGTLVALAALLIVPLIAGALRAASPAGFARLPAEAIVAVLVLLAVSTSRLRWLVGAGFGVLVVAAILLAALDLGFQATIDRPFDAAQDVPAVAGAYGVVSDSAGPVQAILLAALLVAILLAAVLGMARAAIRVARTAEAAGPRGLLAVTGVTAAWILCALTGVQLWPGIPVAAADAVTTLAAATDRAAETVREQQAFELALLSDASPAVAADALLDDLRGKDVVIAFLESYGEVALQDAEFTSGIARVLEKGEAQLTSDGYAARSALLESPTFGGVSWLAHATLQSGVWVDSQRKYDRLMDSSRSTLSRAFRDAGWRTAAVVPSNTQEWPAGTDFYGFDVILDARNLGYRGPAFSYARIPDQFTWQRFHEKRVEDRSPLMAEIDFVSSHTPWVPTPRLVPWSQLGDGSVFDAQADDGPAPLEVWADEQRVREAYGRSIQYTLGAMFSFLHEYDQPDLVLIVVGDHQPARIVSGAEADHDVPVTVIAKDPAVFDEISSWGWDTGVRPSDGAPTWRMDQFRDRFLEAFSD